MENLRIAEKATIRYRDKKLSNIHVTNGNHLKALQHFTEMQESARLLTNKQFGAMMSEVFQAKLSQALGQMEQADQEYKQALKTMEKTLGKHHYLNAAFDHDYADFLFEAEKFADAEQKFHSLETTWRQSFGEDALRMASIHYNISRSISRGALKNTSPISEPERHKELAARAVSYARSAYDQGKKYDAEPELMARLGVYLCHTLIHYEPNPDYAPIEATAREALAIRIKMYPVERVKDNKGEMDTHPLNYLLIALARQDKIVETERAFLDMLARRPQPKWDGNASYTLPEAAAKLAGVGKT